MELANIHSSLSRVFGLALTSFNLFIADHPDASGWFGSAFKTNIH